MVNSRAKGKRGELDAAHLLNHLFPGAEARRGQQYCGTPDSPDLVTSIPGLYVEVKNREAIRLYEWLHAMEMEREPGSVGMLMIKTPWKTPSQNGAFRAPYSFRPLSPWERGNLELPLHGAEPLVLLAESSPPSPLGDGRGEGTSL